MIIQNDDITGLRLIGTVTTTYEVDCIWYPKLPGEQPCIVFPPKTTWLHIGGENIGWLLDTYSFNSFNQM